MNAIEVPYDARQPAAGTHLRLTNSQIYRLIASGFIGTTLESFDFNVYSLLTPLVFNELFFPKLDPAIATIASFSVFAIGLLSRPFGGLIFGHFGDRYGRKPTMVLTLSLMGISTAAIGLIPSYQTIGIWAPIILTALRLLQGIAFGGETTASPVLLSESSPPKKRGLYSSFATGGILAGVLLAAAVVDLVAQLPSADMLGWGWRVPFLGSIVVVGVGMYIRMKVEESPIFTARVTKATALRIPLAEVIRSYKKPTLIALLISISPAGVFFFFSVFGLSYATHTLHLPQATLLQGIMIGNVVGTLLMPICGWLSDMVGRRPVIAGCFVVTAAYAAFGFFPLLQTGNPFYLILATAIPPIIQPFSLGPVSALLSELYSDTRVRFSGVAIGRQVGNVIGGGLVPVLAATIMAATNNDLTYVIVLFGACNILSAWACYMHRETKHSQM